MISMLTKQRTALPGTLVIGIVLHPFWEAPARKEEKVKIRIPPLLSGPWLLPQAALLDLLGLKAIILLL